MVSSFLPNSPLPSVGYCYLAKNPDYTHHPVNERYRLITTSIPNTPSSGTYEAAEDGVVVYHIGS